MGGEKKRLAGYSRTPKIRRRGEKRVLNGRSNFGHEFERVPEKRLTRDKSGKT